MIGIDATSEALLAWVLEACPEIESSYKAAVGTKDQALPDVATEIQSVEIVRSDADGFPDWAIEQVLIRRYRFNLLIVVSPNPPEEATAQLTTFVDALTESLLSDTTLGGRVQGVAPTMSSSFNPPFVEFDDRTTGRLATIEIVVGELVEQED